MTVRVPKGMAVRWPTCISQYGCVTYISNKVSILFCNTLLNKVFSCITVTACKKNDLFVSHNEVRFRCFHMCVCVECLRYTSSIALGSKVSWC